jgi:tRNA (guanine37-N1)-methyltransferase
MTEALTYLSRDPVRHMDMLEPIRRGTAEIFMADETGVLIREAVSGAYFLTAETEKTSSSLLEMIPSARLISAHQDFSVDEAAARFGLNPTMRCRQAAWLQTRPPEAPSSRFDVRPLSPDMAEVVQALYSHDIGMDYINGRLAAGEMWGAFDGVALAGFIGLHEEGSMGMLEVVPEYRRMGVGSLLLSHLCRTLMGKGFTPFSQFTIENTRSRALNEKLGFTISEETVYWLEPPAV